MKKLLVKCLFVGLCLMQTVAVWGGYDEERNVYAQVKVVASNSYGGYVYLDQTDAAYTGEDWRIGEHAISWQGTRKWHVNTGGFDLVPTGWSWFTPFPSKNYYGHARVNDGYYFAGWSEDAEATTGSGEMASVSIKSTAESTEANSPTLAVRYALFNPVAIATPDPATIQMEGVTELGTEYTKTITFTTTGGDSKDDFNEPTISGGGTATWDVTGWEMSGSSVVVTISYIANRDKYNNGTNRTDKATLTLTSKGGGRATCNIEATYDMTINAGSSEAVTLEHPATYVDGIATFPVDKVDNKADVVTSLIEITSGTGTWKVLSHDYADNLVTVNYRYTPDATTVAGTHTATLTLSSNTTKYPTIVKSNTCTLTANVKAAITSGQDQVITLYVPDETSKTAEATFDVKYVAGTDNFNTPIFDNFTRPEGATVATEWTVSALSYADGVLTVSYTFEHTDIEGQYGAQLTLTTTDGDTKTIHLTAYVETRSENAAEVVLAGEENGTPYATWEKALAAANKAEGCTLRLLQDIDLGTLTANQEIKKSMTLDLNGKVLSGTLTSTYLRLLYLNTAGVTLTITDSRMGGAIRATSAISSDKQFAVQVAKGHLVLERGDIEGEFTTTSAPKLGGVHLSASGTSFTMNGGRIIAKHIEGANARGVYIEAGGTTALLNAGTIQATAYKDAHAVIAASSATNPSHITLGNAILKATATTGAYGIYSYGKVIVEGGEITAQARKLKSEDTGETAKGIYMLSESYADAAKCHYGILEVTGGIITAKAEKNAYGIDLSATNGTKSTIQPAVDGTYSNKAAATGKIENATINAIAETAITTSAAVNAYGVIVRGSDNSKDLTTTPLILKNVTINTSATSTSIGVYAEASVSSSTGHKRQAHVELTDCNITSITTGHLDEKGDITNGATARAVYVMAAQNTNASSSTWPNEENATASSVKIFGGKYVAMAATTNAYGVHATRAITTAGGAVAYPDVVIRDAEFEVSANLKTGNANAYGLHCAGKTTVDNTKVIVSSPSNYAYGCYVTSGDFTATHTTFDVTASTYAFGARADAAIASNAMIEEIPVVNFNNVTANIKTTTGNEAYGVWLNGATKASGEVEKAVFAKTNIYEGTFTITASAANAYGVLTYDKTRISTTGKDWEGGEVKVREATFIVTAGTASGAYGVKTNGPTEIDKCDITTKATTTGAYGVYVYDNTTKLTNSTITSTTSGGSAYGVWVNAEISNIANIAGWNFVGKLESEKNTVTARVTNADKTKAYGLWLATKAITATNAPTGDYACAASATLTNDVYTAIAETGKTAYAVGLQDPATKNTATATPTCTINSGKFKGLATSDFADVNALGLTTNFVIRDGYFTSKVNVDKFVEEGKALMNIQTTMPEYADGYRYYVGNATAPGIGVCKIGDTHYKTLEEALQVVNSNTTAATIVMTNSYTLPKGNYVLPSHAILLVPYNASQSSMLGIQVKRNSTWTAPSPYMTLSFAEGVNFTIKGNMEIGGEMCSKEDHPGSVCGPYGHLHLDENVRVNVEAGAALYAWGYVTGDGIIDIKKDARVYEAFQIGDWKGGSCSNNMLNNKERVFPVTHYYYQNIECELIYHAGVRAYGSLGVDFPSFGVTAEINSVQLVGIRGITNETNDNAMFLMDPAANGENVWITKKYNPEEDRIYWTLNSNTTLSSLNVEIKVSMLDRSMNSADYVLPLPSNMTITLNSGVLDMLYDVYLMPGLSLNIAKEAKLFIPTGQSMYVVDNDEWLKGYGCGIGYIHTPYYSPSWNGATSPRAYLKNDKTHLPDAEIFVHGAIDIEGNLYTTAGGAWIHSTNEDAGKISFVNAAGANGTWNTFETWSGERFEKPTYKANTVTSAQLTNTDADGNRTSFTQTVGTAKGKSFNYINNQWVCLDEGCISTTTDGTGTHHYIQADATIEVMPDGNGDGTYSNKNADGTAGDRRFINTESATACVWYEVGNNNDGHGYFANNPKYENCGGYYTYVADEGYWEEVMVNVTWVGEGITIDAPVHKGTSPVYLGADPVKSGYAWVGWTSDGGVTVRDRNTTTTPLPKVMDPIIYEAEYKWIPVQHTITFKDRDGKPIKAGLFTEGDRPTCDAEVPSITTEKITYTFSHQWKDANGKLHAADNLPKVTAPADYTADYTEATTSYPIHFVNYDGKELYVEDFAYGATPVYHGPTPTQESNSAYSYEFTGWVSSQGAETFVTVTGEETYTAQYKAIELEYGDWFDVVNAESGKLVLNLNGYTTASGSTEWEITVGDNQYDMYNRATNRTLTVDLPAGVKADDKVLILAKDEDGKVESRRNYVVPHVYTGATLGTVAEDYSSIVYVKSGILAVAQDATLAAIYVAPGAELKIESGVTLAVTKLVLRTDETAAAILTNEGTLLCKNVNYSRVVNKKGHFPIALPFDVDLNDVVFSHGMKATVGKHFALSYYNAQRRADEGSSSLNWQVLPSETQKMNAQQAYYFYAPNSTYQEYYFPVAYKQDVIDAKVEVTRWEGTHPDRGNWGWNAVCSPYTGRYATQAITPEEAVKISLLQVGETTTWYQQLSTLELDYLKPATLFFYQAKANGNLVFGSDQFRFEEPAALSAPRSIVARRTLANVSSAQTQWIRLEYSNADGKIDRTNIYLHPDKFSSEYDLGYDVQKLSTSGSAPFIWTSAAYGDLAFAALPDTLAMKGIALSLFVPADGEMALTMLDNQWMSRLSHVYLVDMQEGVQVDLLESDYTWMAEAGTSTGRFYLYPILRSPAEDNTVTTLPSRSETEALVAYSVAKNIMLENVPVGTNVRCFDLSGRLVASCTASAAQVMFAVPASGVYFVHAENGVQKVMVNK